MKSEKQTHTDDAYVMVAFVILIAIVILLSGCVSTVIPIEKVGNSPSYSGSKLNSGVIEVIPNVGRIVDPSWVAAYNQDVKDYGSDSFFSVPLKENDGIIKDGSNFFVDSEHAVDFDMMNTWRHNGTHKPKTWLQEKTGL